MISSSASSAAESTPRFLVVSMGSIGRRHLRNLRQLRPAAQLAVLRTRGISSVEGAAPEPADVEFSSLEQALAFRPDAAIIASPATLHLAIAEELARAGIPLLIEKPLSACTAGLPRFLEQARTAGLFVAVGYNLRFLPSLAHARNLLLRGEIGDVISARAEVGQFLPDWRPAARYQETVSAQRSLGGGALLELSHELDYLHWIFGVPGRVTARGGTLSGLEIDVEDVVELCLEYAAPRRLVNVHLDFLQKPAHRSCRFIGTRGTLVWNAIANSIAVYRESLGAWEEIAFPAADGNQTYLDELQEFLAGPGGPGRRLASAGDGFDVVAVVEAAKASMEAGRTMEVHRHAGL